MKIIITLDASIDKEDLKINNQEMLIKLSEDEKIKINLHYPDDDDDELRKKLIIKIGKKLQIRKLLGFLKLKEDENRNREKDAPIIYECIKEVIKENPNMKIRANPNKEEEESIEKELKSYRESPCKENSEHTTESCLQNPVRFKVVYYNSNTGRMEGNIKNEKGIIIQKDKPITLNTFYDYCSKAKAEVKKERNKK